MGGSKNPGEYETPEIRINGLWGGRGRKGQNKRAGGDRRWPKLRSTYTDCAFILCIERGRAGGSPCYPDAGHRRGMTPLRSSACLPASSNSSVTPIDTWVGLAPLPDSIAPPFFFLGNICIQVAASLLPTFCVLFFPAFLFFFPPTSKPIFFNFFLLSFLLTL